MIMDYQQQVISTRFNQLIGNVSKQPFFSGCGLFFRSKWLFSVLINGEVYLRATGDFAEKLQKLGGFPFLTTPNTPLSNYYKLPPKLLQDDSMCRKLLMVSLSQLKQERELSTHPILRKLPNFSLKHERLLKKIGIETIAHFRQVGAIGVILNLKKHALPTSETLYFQCVGALTWRNYNEISEQEKNARRRELSQVLHQHGFRQLRRTKPKK